MNAGYLSQLSVAMNAQVIGIEPQVDCHDLAFLAAQMNQWQDRMKTYVAGAWFSKMELEVASSCNTGFQISSRPKTKNKVSTVIADDVIKSNGWSNINIVKIDTEGNFARVKLLGAEVGVLRGLLKAIRSKLVDNFVIETVPHAWKNYGLSFEDGLNIFNEIEQQGYDFHILFDDTEYSKEILGWERVLINGITEEIILMPKGGAEVLFKDRAAKGSGTNLWIKRK